MPASLAPVRPWDPWTFAVAFAGQAFHLAPEVVHRPVQFAELALHSFQALILLAGLALGALAAVRAGNTQFAFPADVFGEVGQAGGAEMLHGFAQVLVPLFGRRAAFGSRLAPSAGRVAVAHGRAVHAGRLIPHLSGLPPVAPVRLFVGPAAQFLAAALEFVRARSLAAIGPFGAPAAFLAFGTFGLFGIADRALRVGGKGRGNEAEGGDEREKERARFHGKGRD